jgi:hypothetical protein
VVESPAAHCIVDSSFVLLICFYVSRINTRDPNSMCPEEEEEEEEEQILR